MAQIQGEEIYLSHSGQDIDDTIDEVQAARGSEASLSARLTDIVSDFEADQQRQDTEIASKVTMQQAYSDGTLIESNSNLNTYTTAGLYYATIAVAATLANSPYTSSGFKLVVEKNTLSGAAVFQTLIPTSGTNVSTVYKRVYENGAWGSWYRFTGEPVSSVQSAPASLMQAGRLDAELTGAETDEEDEER